MSAELAEYDPWRCEGSAVQGGSESSSGGDTEDSLNNKWRYNCVCQLMLR